VGKGNRAGRSTWCWPAGARARTAIHGATFSSLGLDKHSPRSAVQIGSPITQKMLSDFLEVACRRGLVKCATDDGAGAPVGRHRRARAAGRRREIWLEKVPLKYPGLQPWEIFLSESQERMTLVVTEAARRSWPNWRALYEVEATVIGSSRPRAFWRCRTPGGRWRSSISVPARRRAAQAARGRMDAARRARTGDSGKTSTTPTS
jgi:phosphoribosylformylglycinamidine synthase